MIVESKQYPSYRTVSDFPPLRTLDEFRQIRRTEGTRQMQPDYNGYLWEVFLSSDLVDDTSDEYQSYVRSALSLETELNLRFGSDDGKKTMTARVRKWLGEPDEDGKTYEITDRQEKRLEFWLEIERQLNAWHFSGMRQTYERKAEEDYRIFEENYNRRIDEKSSNVVDPPSEKIRAIIPCVDGDPETCASIMDFEWQPSAPGLKISCVEFSWLQVPNTYYFRVIRDATLRPHYPKSAETERSYVTNGALWLVRFWRRTIETLFEAKVLPFAGYCQRFHFAVNCRPAAVITKQRTSLCGVRFCPHCWGRQVGDVWNDVDHVLFPRANGEVDDDGDEPKPKQSRKKSRGGFHLVEVRMARPLELRVSEAIQQRFGDGEDALAFPAARAMPAFKELFTKRLRKFLPKGKDEGHITSFSWFRDSNAPAARGRWKVEGKAILLFRDAPKRLEEMRKAGFVVKHHERPDRKQLSEVIAKLLEYPHVLLYMTKGELVAFWSSLVDKDVSKIRLWERGGIFRQTAPVQYVEEAPKADKNRDGGGWDDSDMGYVDEGHGYCSSRGRSDDDNDDNDDGDGGYVDSGSYDDDDDTYNYGFNPTYEGDL